MKIQSAIAGFNGSRRGRREYRGEGTVVRRARYVGWALGGNDVGNAVDARVDRLDRAESGAINQSHSRTIGLSVTMGVGSTDSVLASRRAVLPIYEVGERERCSLVDLGGHRAVAPLFPEREVRSDCPLADLSGLPSRLGIPELPKYVMRQYSNSVRWIYAGGFLVSNAAFQTSRGLFW